jgi:3',5'-cyclic AMP phosphodiesterase CpdA
MTAALAPRAVRLLHLSDLHLTGDGSLHLGRVDTLTALRRVLDRLSDLRRLDAVVLSGDLAEDGTPAAYERLREAVQPWAAERGAELVYAMGNHDEADAFEAQLGPRRRVVDLDDVRIVVTDSAIPGWPGGRLGGEQLDWLGDVLESPGQGPTVVVVHHPPLPAMTPVLAAMELADSTRLLDVCRRAGVSLVLSGHYHHSLVTDAGGVLVAVAPAVANTNDLGAPPGHDRAVTGSGCALVTIPRNGRPSVSAVMASAPDDGEALFDLDADAVTRLLAEVGSEPVTL